MNVLPVMEQVNVSHIPLLILVLNVRVQDTKRNDMKKEFKIDTSAETHITNKSDCHCFECRQWETKNFLKEKHKQEEEYVLGIQQRKKRKSKT